MLEIHGIHVFSFDAVQLICSEMQIIENESASPEPVAVTRLS